MPNEKKSNAGMKRHDHVGLVEVLRLYKVLNLGWSSVPAGWSDSRLLLCVCVRTLSDCSNAPHKRHHRRIKIEDYIFMHINSLLSRSSSSMLNIEIVFTGKKRRLNIKQTFLLISTLAVNIWNHLNVNWLQNDINFSGTHLKSYPV